MRRAPVAELPGASALAAVAFLSLLILPSTPCGAECARGPLADSLRSAVAEVDPQAHVGVLAVSLDRGDTLVALNEALRMITGSNAKVFTTCAFLRRYGPAARFSTSLEARGAVERKKGRIRLKGDLVLRPAGVPDVTAILAPGSRGLLDSLAVLLRATGLERFEGTLWVDGTLFADEGYGPGWAVEDVPWSYGTVPTAVMANGNAATLIATGGDKRVDISFDPPETPLVVESSPALGEQGGPGGIDVDRSLGARALRVLGVVPRGATLKKQISVPQPDSTAGLWLFGAMRRAGIEVGKAAVRLVPHDADGGAREGDSGRAGRPGPVGSAAATGPGPAAPADTGWASVRKDRPATVVTLLSPPAAAMVGVVLPLSLNAEAEAMLRLLDPAPREKRRASGLVESRRAATEAGVDTLDLSLVDGSGLSPQDLATPRSLVAWLAAMARDSVLAAPFRDALAEPGALGTLQRRFAGLPPGAELRAKSGTLTNVSTLSGYVTSAAGERIAFAIMTNGNRGSTTWGKQLEERVVGMLARRGGAGSAAGMAGMAGSPPPRIPR